MPLRQRSDAARARTHTVCVPSHRRATHARTTHHATAVTVNALNTKRRAYGGGPPPIMLLALTCETSHQTD
jgi:hypothetical protein